MDEVATLLGALLFPVVGMLVLLWLGHLEDTLPRDVRAAGRSPDPDPIRAVELAESPAEVLEAPVGPAPVVTGEPAQAFSRSGTLSLGGSTKR